MVSHFTAVFEQEGDWWIGFVEELPGANTQGATREEARENLKEAVSLLLEANRELAEGDVAEKMLEEARRRAEEAAAAARERAEALANEAGAARQRAEALVKESREKAAELLQRGRRELEEQPALVEQEIGGGRAGRKVIKEELVVLFDEAP